jgi:hypothetical protein
MVSGSPCRALHAGRAAVQTVGAEVRAAFAVNASVGRSEATMSELAKRIQHSLAWRTRAAISYSSDILQGVRAARLNRRMDRVAVDPRITYPSYKSLDAYIDVDRLKSLDGYLKDRIARDIHGQNAMQFDTGELKSTLLGRTRPGSKLIHLSVPKLGDRVQYFENDDPELWKISEESREYSELMEFIGTLPFKATARIVIMCDDQGRVVTRHRDHSFPDINHEFVWFRTNLDKAFYVQDRKSKKKLYVSSYSAWFDTVNQFHGADAGKPALTFSIRVDGTFSDEFRALIPVPPYNPASTSALWASLSG